MTVERNRIYEGRVKEGDLPRIELVQNERLIASREAKLVEAERKLQKGAIKLSLYLRDEAGQPLVPGPELLPADFPAAELPELSEGAALVTASLASRPELRELDVIRQQIEVDLRQAQNLCLPELNATLDAAQDIGGATPKKDKSPFQLQAGLYLDVPLERNKAQGKIRESQGKLAQLSAKRRLVENKITIEVQDAISARNSGSRALPAGQGEYRAGRPARYRRAPAFRRPGQRPLARGHSRDGCDRSRPV